MASSIQNEDIAKLREVGYLTADIRHRLPTPGQVIPTPEPNECVVFVPHFLRGLGLTLDPFVRGLMFYYGLDFHDLAPDSLLHISTFIVVCQAFLRGLGFTLDPFMRGLMFYYGLDFHDLAPDAILHISLFIIVCVSVKTGGSRVGGPELCV